jgi:cerevisin
MRFTSFAVLAAFVAPILAGPVALKTVETAKERKEGSYIVTLKPTVEQATHIDRLQNKFRGEAAVVHAQWDPEFLNGFAAKLSTEALNDLRAHPDVASISEDGIAHTFTTQVRML